MEPYCEELHTFLKHSLLFALPLLLGALFILGTELYSGEVRTIPEIVRFEIAHPRQTLFSRGIVDQEIGRYKYEGILQRDPHAIVIGSSRVMQMREEMFANHLRFYNAGGILSGIGDLPRIAPLLWSKPNLSVIFVGLDYYWFGDKQGMSTILTFGDDREPLDDIDPYIAVTRSFLSRTQEDQTFLLAMLRRKDAFSGKVSLGLQALQGNGFRYDGSYQYASYIAKRRLNPIFHDLESPPIPERVKQGLLQFQFGNSFDYQRLHILETFLQQAKERHIAVVGFAPPFSKEVYRGLTTSPHHKLLFATFRREIARTFKDNGFPFFDFSDITRFGLDDQYMFDGFHTTETGMAVLLQAMFSSPAAQIPIVPNQSIVAELEKKLRRPSTTPFELSL